DSLQHVCNVAHFLYQSHDDEKIRVDRMLRYLEGSTYCKFKYDVRCGSDKYQVTIFPLGEQIAMKRTKNNAAVALLSLEKYPNNFFVLMGLQLFSQMDTMAYFQDHNAFDSTRWSNGTRLLPLVQDLITKNRFDISIEQKLNKVLVIVDSIKNQTYRYIFRT